MKTTRDKYIDSLHGDDLEALALHVPYSIDELKLIFTEVGSIDTVIEVIADAQILHKSIEGILVEYRLGRERHEEVS